MKILSDKVFSTEKIEDPQYSFLYPDGRLKIVFEDDTYRIHDIDGTIRWFDEQGRKHYEGDLSAVLRPDGTQSWYVHGKLRKCTVQNSDGSYSMFYYS